MKLGSLFDGSGGFPLAGALCGIEPVWASEIEKYPLKVTGKRFPGMKQLGDVTKISGAEAEPVDIITFGSPCQDLSVAGKRAGIHDGARSSLFFEAIRIIKEMRDATADKFPRFAVWENVPGAFSSHGGEDFRAVLRALAGVKDPGADVPGSPRGGWNAAGCIVGDGYSIAWRVYDAQYWGVPQRRKRIYLIADFADERAGEILFEPESMRRNPEKGAAPWENSAGNVAGSAGRSGQVFCLQGNGIDRADTAGCNGCGWNGGGIAYTLNTIDRQAVVCYAPEGNHCGSYREDDISATLQTKYHYGGGGDAALVIENHPGDSRCDFAKDNVVPTLTAKIDTGGGNVPMILEKAVTYIQPSFGEFREDDIANTLKASDAKRVDPGAYVLEERRAARKYIVRRLTPLECCRLQGFPDWWCDGVEGSDSAQYKMWGNGIALPCAVDVLWRITRAVEKES